MQNELLGMTVEGLFVKYPYAEDFFSFLSERPAPSLLLSEFFVNISDEVLQDLGMNRCMLIDHFHTYMAQMEQMKQQEERISSITILGGQDKNGVSEHVSLTINTGEIICIVGATGSGKSRLLADIEWMAQQDTPTKRTILINGKQPDFTRRFSVEKKLVAQLSQNMNFVMDLTVSEFVGMHAESRMVEHIEEVTNNIIEQANALAGEKFLASTPVTALSGGQSRALMIADAAFLSICPIVLIDELENAGIDRRQALRLLVDKQKIVLMATHDPILALMGDRRIVIKNGGIHQIIETSDRERQNLLVLEKLDQQLSVIREALRQGKQIEESFIDLSGLMFK